MTVIGQFLNVCQPYVLHDSFLTVVQVPCLGHQDTFSLLIFSDGIQGFAHTLSSSLIRRRCGEDYSRCLGN